MPRAPVLLITPLVSSVSCGFIQDFVGSFDVFLLQKSLPSRVFLLTAVLPFLHM
jgi:hypothetical protein